MPPRPKLQLPAISISTETDFERDAVPAVRPTNLIIPTLMVQTPSPTMEHKTPPVCPGSPPPQSASECTKEFNNFVFPPSKAQQKK